MKKRTSDHLAACRGFTLIEIMTVVAIIGILAALALPNYIEHVRRGHRAEARAALLQATQWLERAATASGSYPADLPEPLQTVPGGRYDIALTAEGTRFMLTATPKGSQFGDKCGSLTLNQAGERGLRGNAAELADCWDR